MVSSPALRFSKSLWSDNPIPRGCVGYWPLWHPNLRGGAFKSIDPFRHDCIVTGATKVEAGYSGDVAGDDSIACGAGTGIANIWDGGGTVIVWVNLVSDGLADTGRILGKRNGYYLLTREEAAGKVKLRFLCDFSAGDGFWTTTATVVTIGTPTLIAITYDSGATANNPTFYIKDSAAQTVLTVGSGLSRNAPGGARVSDTANTLFLLNSVGTAVGMEGILQEVWLYNVALSPIELDYIFNQTRGRNQ